MPLVSMKSWWVMPLGSTWCSRKAPTKLGPRIGVSADPKLSARKWTNPERKSAARYASDRQDGQQPRVAEARHPPEHVSPRGEARARRKRRSRRLQARNVPCLSRGVVVPERPLGVGSWGLLGSGYGRQITWCWMEVRSADDRWISERVMGAAVGAHASCGSRTCFGLPDHHVLLLLVSRSTNERRSYSKRTSLKPSVVTKALMLSSALASAVSRMPFSRAAPSTFSIALARASSTRSSSGRTFRGLKSRS